MSLALWQTWGLKMRTSQKISVSTIYCLVVALMVLDIVRTVESLVYRSWTRSTLFDILEVVLVVIITALPGYRFVCTGHRLDPLKAKEAHLESAPGPHEGHPGDEPFRASIERVYEDTCGVRG